MATFPANLWTPPLFWDDRIEECRLQTVRKRYLENIVVAGAWNFKELHSIRIELCQGSPHLRGDDVVRFSMKEY
jgi:hypothetical protein